MTASDAEAKHGNVGYHPPNQRFTFEVLKVAVLSAIGGFLFGYHTGVISAAIIYIKDTIEGSNHSLSYAWQEAIVSVTIFGAFIFSIFAGSCADKYGRRKVILAASSSFALGSIFMGFAGGKWTLLIGRFIAGAGVGLASMVTPTYIAEMAPAHVRGSLVTVNSLFITGGQAIAAISAGFISISGIEKYADGSLGWRLMLFLPVIPAIVQFIGMIFMPESPRWLISEGYSDKARQALQRIRGPDADVSSELNSMMNRSIDDSGNISGSKADEDESKWILLKVIRDRGLRKALLVGSVLQAVQQLTGINSVLYYAATIVTMSGVYDKSLAVWLAAVITTVNFLTGFIGLILVERIGRRLLLLLSLGGVILSLGILGFAFQIGDNNAPNITAITLDRGDNTSYRLINQCMTYTSCRGCISDGSCGYCFHDVEGGVGSCLAGDESVNFGVSLFDSCSNGTTAGDKQIWAFDWCPSKHSWITLCGLCLYLFFFGPGMGPMPWTINSEIFPTWCRGVCYSATTSVNWLSNFLVSYTFLTLARAVSKQGAFWIYALIGGIGFVFFYFNLPETKGKSLEETSRLFDNKKKTRVIRAEETKNSDDAPQL